MGYNVRFIALNESSIQTTIDSEAERILRNVVEYTKWYIQSKSEDELLSSISKKETMAYICDVGDVFSRFVDTHSKVYITNQSDFIESGMGSGLDENSYYSGVITENMDIVIFRNNYTFPYRYDERDGSFYDSFSNLHRTTWYAMKVFLADALMKIYRICKGEMDYPDEIIPLYGGRLIDRGKNDPTTCTKIGKPYGRFDELFYGYGKKDTSNSAYLNELKYAKDDFLKLVNDAASVVENSIKKYGNADRIKLNARSEIKSCIIENCNMRAMAIIRNAFSKLSQEAIERLKRTGELAKHIQKAIWSDPELFIVRRGPEYLDAVANAAKQYYEDYDTDRIFSTISTEGFLKDCSRIINRDTITSFMDCELVSYIPTNTDVESDKVMSESELESIGLSKKDYEFYMNADGSVHFKKITVDVNKVVFLNDLTILVYCLDTITSPAINSMISIAIKRGYIEIEDTYDDEAIIEYTYKIVFQLNEKEIFKPMRRAVVDCALMTFEDYFKKTALSLRKSGYGDKSVIDSVNKFAANSIENVFGGIESKPKKDMFPISKVKKSGKHLTYNRSL